MFRELYGAHQKLNAAYQNLDAHHQRLLAIQKTQLKAMSKMKKIKLKEISQIKENKLKEISQIKQNQLKEMSQIKDELQELKLQEARHKGIIEGYEKLNKIRQPTQKKSKKRSRPSS